MAGRIHAEMGEEGLVDFLNAHADSLFDVGLVHDARRVRVDEAGRVQPDDDGVIAARLCEDCLALVVGQIVLIEHQIELVIGHIAAHMILN